MADYSRLPGPVEDHWTWQQHAACTGLQTAMFFHPDYERGPARDRRESAAKAVCERCPVITQCRSHALTVHEPYGIWGGLSAQERKALERTERRVPVLDDGQPVVA